MRMVDLSKLDLRPLYLFVQVAEAGSFSKAASTLSIGQPVLSREIKQLEERYGVQLLHRDGRGVSLTEAGTHLIARAKELLQGLDQTEHEISAVRGTPSGRVAIGVPPLFGHVLTYDLIRHFRKDFPQISLLFMEGFTTDFLEWLAKGTVDLAVMYKPPAISTLIAEHLFDDRLYLVGAPGALSAFVGSDIAFRQLAGLPLVMAPHPHRLRSSVETAAKEAGIALSIEVEADGTATILDLVRGGIGLTVLPHSLVEEDARAGFYDVRRLTEPAVTPELYVVTSMQRPVTVATKFILAAIRRRFQPRA
jgi:LysR family nitrogen assimilation transcriptional regulator